MNWRNAARLSRPVGRRVARATVTIFSWCLLSALATHTVWATSNPRFGVGGPIAKFDVSGHEYWRLHIGWHFFWGGGFAHHEMLRGLPRRTFFTLPHHHGGGLPSADRVRKNAAENPEHYPDGKIWSIGNEIGFDDGPQSPESYARVLNEAIQRFKGVNASWQIYTGAVILGKGWWSYPKHGPRDPNFRPGEQITAAEYMDRVNQWFLTNTGKKMPVDGFVVHGYHYLDQHPAYNTQSFKDAVIEFRRWMKEAGFQDRPVVMKELGNFSAAADPGRVDAYLRDVVAWMSTAREVSIGMPTDDHRLVQRWAWFHTAATQPPSSATSLFDADTRTLTVLGRSYAELAERHLPVHENLDGKPDLLAVTKTGSSLHTEVNVLKSEHGFRSFLLDSATALSRSGSAYEFGVADYNLDGHFDLYAIKKSGTGSHSTEVHVLDGAANFSRFLAHTATALHETGRQDGTLVHDWNGDGYADLWYLKKQKTGSKRTEVHILDGKNGFGRFLFQRPTALHETGDEAEFELADWNRDGVPDLWYLKKKRTGSKTTELHILDGRNGFQSYLLHTTTALHQTGEEADFLVADYDRDGIFDLWYVKKTGGGSKQTEVHILSGRGGFKQFLTHAATSLFPAGLDDRFFVVP